MKEESKVNELIEECLSESYGIIADKIITSLKENGQLHEIAFLVQFSNVFASGYLTILQKCAEIDKNITLKIINAMIIKLNEFRHENKIGE